MHIVSYVRNIKPSKIDDLDLSLPYKDTAGTIYLLFIQFLILNLFFRYRYAINWKIKGIQTSNIEF